MRLAALAPVCGQEAPTSRLRGIVCLASIIDVVLVSVPRVEGPISPACWGVFLGIAPYTNREDNKMHPTKIVSTTTMVSPPFRPYSAARLSPLPIALLACLVTAAGLGCKQEASSTSAQAKPEVEVVEAVQKDVPIYSEWIGSADGMVNAIIKAQVSGYLMKQNYVEGAFVKKGQVLFEIDPRKLQAALDQAKGQWEKAQAQVVKTQQDVKRDTPLAQGGAISQKELDDSTQLNLAARASMASAKAAVEEAQLNVAFAKIIAPIDGVVGIAKAQVGDLVGPGDELTSMSTLDPIRVYFPVSEQEYFAAAEKIQQAYKEREQNKDRPGVLELILGDGTVFPHKGKYLLVNQASRREDRNHSTRRAVSQPGQSSSSGTIRSGTSHHPNQRGSGPGSSTHGN